MTMLHSVLLNFHLAVGLGALVLFWVPALTRKGSPLHRRAGRWYTGAMALVLVTGVLLATMFLAQGRWVPGTFLLFLGVITGTSLWNGWRVLRAKRDIAEYVGGVHRALGVLNVASGAAMVALGIVLERPLLLWFGPVGFLIGGTMLATAWRPRVERKYWYREHLTGMIGSGIASHVAFLAFGGRQLFGWGNDGYAVWLWVAPLAIGTLAIALGNVYYRAKHAAEVAPATA